jgi:endonuclease III
MTIRPPNATPEAAAQITALLADRWPDVRVELDHASAYQLLVATILAAQSTDKMINTITPALFARFPDPASLAAADQGELEQLIFRSGFYRNKARHLIGMARAIVAEHGGVVPDTMEGLCSLPGVARKTANVVLGNALGKHEGIVVDTHVTRVAQRLGLTAQTDPVKIELELMALVPRAQWTAFGNRVIHHGRYICLAKQPQHDRCPLAPLCPSATLGAIAPARAPKAKARPKARPKPKPKARPKAKARPTPKATPKATPARTRRR